MGVFVSFGWRAAPCLVFIKPFQMSQDSSVIDKKENRETQVTWPQTSPSFVFLPVILCPLLNKVLYTIRYIVNKAVLTWYTSIQRCLRIWCAMFPIQRIKFKKVKAVPINFYLLSNKAENQNSLLDCELEIVYVKHRGALSISVYIQTETHWDKGGRSTVYQ